MSDAPRLSRRAFAIIFSLSMTTAIGNNGLQSVLPSIGRSIGIADSMVAAIFLALLAVVGCVIAVLGSSIGSAGP